MKEVFATKLWKAADQNKNQQFNHRCPYLVFTNFATRDLFTLIFLPQYYLVKKGTGDNIHDRGDVENILVPPGHTAIFHGKSMYGGHGPFEESLQWRMNYRLEHEEDVAECIEYKMTIHTDRQPQQCGVGACENATCKTLDKHPLAQYWNYESALTIHMPDGHNAEAMARGKAYGYLYKKGFCFVRNHSRTEHHFLFEKQLQKFEKLLQTDDGKKLSKALCDGTCTTLDQIDVDDAPAVIYEMKKFPGERDVGDDDEQKWILKERTNKN
jgi:hypothetical protein